MPTEHCEPIRNDIDALEKDILSLQEVLPEVPPVLRKSIEATIKREKVHLLALKRALKACEAGR